MDGGDLDRDARRRRELGQFLRARRVLVTPESVGLARLPRRHVRGLRREDVADLAGVGLSWYARLEQGRLDPINPALLRAVVTALRLGPLEAKHAAILARSAWDLDPLPGPPYEREAFVDIVRAYVGGVAFATDAAQRVTAWNSSGVRWFGFGELAPSERNLLALMVRAARFRRVFVDWEATLARMIGVYRAARAAAGAAGPDDAALIAALRSEDSAFDRLWRRYIVDAPTSHVCRLRDPVAGERRMHFSAFHPADEPGATVVILRDLPNTGNDA